MRVVLLWFVELILLTTSVLGTTFADQYFINPPKSGPTSEFITNNVYAVGSQIDVSWNTTWTDYMLVLFQDTNDTYQTLTQSSKLSGETKYRWKTTVDGLFDLTRNNVFFFAIFQLQSSTPSTFFSCHYFNITNNEVDALGNRVKPSSTMSLGISTPTAAPSSTPTSSLPGKSSDNKLALAVGLGIGIPLAVALGLGFGYVLSQRRKRRATQANVEKNAYYPATDNYSTHAYLGQEVWPQEVHGSSKPHELPSRTDVGELPGNQTHSFMVPTKQ